MELSISNILSKAWDLTKKHGGFFIPAILLFAIIQVCTMFLFKGSSFETIAGNIISSLGAFFITQQCLKMLDGKTPSFKEIEFPFKVFVKYFVANILLGIIIVLGIIAFIIPGLIAMARLGFVSTIIIDNPEIGIIDAFKKSIEITSNYTWKLVGLYFMFIAISLLGFLALIVGLLWSATVCGIASVIAYRLLKENQEVIPSA